MPVPALSPTLWPTLGRGRRQHAEHRAAAARRPPLARRCASAHARAGKICVYVDPGLGACREGVRRHRWREPRVDVSELCRQKPGSFDELRIGECALHAGCCRQVRSGTDLPDPVFGGFQGFECEASGLTLFATRTSVAGDCVTAVDCYQNTTANYIASTSLSACSYEQLVRELTISACRKFHVPSTLWRIVWLTPWSNYDCSVPGRSLYIQVAQTDEAISWRIGRRHLGSIPRDLGRAL